VWSSSYYPVFKTQNLVPKHAVGHISHFIYNLLNNTVNSCHRKSTGRNISEKQRKSKWYGYKQSHTIQDICTEGLRKITKNQSQTSWCLGLDVNQALSGMKSKTLLLEPTSSIIHISCSTYKTVSSAMIILISDACMPVVLGFSLIALTTKVVSYTTVQRVFTVEMWKCKDSIEYILMYVMFFNKYCKGFGTTIWIACVGIRKSQMCCW